MLAIDLIYLGNDKEPYYNQAADEYIKRLGAFCSFHAKNLKDERLSDRPSESEIRAALDKEGKRIREALPERSYKIAMCVEGRQMSSEEFAGLLETLPSKGYSGAAFIIGSSCGISEEVKTSCDLKLSVSKMTFPHKLFRVMLLEQLYRAFTILSGGRYHK